LTLFVDLQNSYIITYTGVNYIQYNGTLYYCNSNVTICCAHAFFLFFKVMNSVQFCKLIGEFVSSY